MLDLHNSTLVLYRTTRIARHSIHTVFRFCLAALFTLLCLWLGCVLWVVGLFVRQPASLPPHTIVAPEKEEVVESKAVVPVTPPLPLLQTSCETAIHVPVHMNNNTTTATVDEATERGVQETIVKEQQQQQQSSLLCTSSLVADKSAVSALTSYSTSSSTSPMVSSSAFAPHSVGPIAASHPSVDETYTNTKKEAVVNEAAVVAVDEDMHTSASTLITTITTPGNMTDNELLTDEPTATATTHTNMTTMLSDEGQSALPSTAAETHVQLQQQTMSEAADTLSVVPTTTTTAADVLHNDDTGVQQEEEERSMSAHAIPRLPLHTTQTSAAVGVIRPSLSPSPRSVRTSSARTTTTTQDQAPRNTLCVKEAADKGKSEQVKKKSNTTTTTLSTTRDTKADAARTTQLTRQTPRVHTRGDNTEWKNDTPRTSTACNSAREEIKSSDSTAMTALLQALEQKERALHTLQRDQVRREAQMRRQVHDLQRALSAEQSARVESEEQVNELLAFMPLSGRERDALEKMSARSAHSHGIPHKQHKHTTTTTTNEAKHPDSSSNSSSDEEDALFMKEGCVVSSIPSASSGRRGTPTSWSIAAHDAFDSHAALSSRISLPPQQHHHHEEEYDACSEPQSAKSRGSRGKSTGRTSSMSPSLQALSARRQQQQEEKEVDEGRLYEVAHDDKKKKEVEGYEGKVQPKASRKSTRKGVSVSPRDCSAHTHTTTTTTTTNNSTPRQDSHDDDEEAEGDAAQMQEEEGEANNSDNGAVRVPPLLTWPTTTITCDNDTDLPTHMDDGARLSEGFWQRLRAREERARARVRREFVLQAQARLHQEQSKCRAAEELARRAQREARRATSARESAERTCATLEKKVQELQSQLHECQLQLNELTQRHAGLQSELTSKSEYCTSMEQRLSDYTATMAQQIAEYEARLQEERTQCAQLHKEMTSKEVALQRMSSSNEALQAALHRTLAQAAQAEERARHLLHKKEILSEQQLTQRESELQAWRVRCEQAERSLADCLSKQREELTRVQREAEQRCEAYRLQLSEASVERRSLALRLEHLEKLVLQQRQRYDGQSMPYHNIELVDRATLVVRLSAEATALREELHRVCAAREEEKEKALQDYLSLSQEMHALKQANAQLAMAAQSDANERRRRSSSALRDNNNESNNNKSRSVSGCAERGLLTYSAEKPNTTTTATITTTQQQQLPTSGMATTASVLRSHSSLASSSFPSLRSTQAVQRHMPNNNNNNEIVDVCPQEGAKEEQADMHNIIPTAAAAVQTPPTVSSTATAVTSALQQQQHTQPSHEATQPVQPCELTNSNTSPTQSGMPYSSITSNDNIATRHTRSSATAAAMLSSPMSHRYSSLHGRGDAPLVHHELAAQAELPLPRRSALRSLPTNAFMSTASTNTVQPKVRCESEAAELLHKCTKAATDKEEDEAVRQPSQPYMPLTMDRYNVAEEDNVEDEETTMLLRTPSTKTTRKSVPQQPQPTTTTSTSNEAVEEALHVLTSPAPRPPVMSA